MALSDSEVIAIIGEELAHCDNTYLGTFTSYHAERRARNLSLYFGEPLGTEVKGQSSWVSRDSLETVEAAMPELLRAFSDAKQSVAFIPHDDSIEAEKAAKEETEAVRHVFFNANNGFLNLYEWIKTALIQYNGYLRCEEGTQTKYKTRKTTLTLEEFQALLVDPDWDLKGKPKFLLNGEEVDRKKDVTDEQVFRALLELRAAGAVVAVQATFRESMESQRIHIEGVAPENMFVTLSHRSIDLQDCRFVAERLIMTPTELRRMGVSDADIDTIPDYFHLWTREEAARHQDAAIFGRRTFADDSVKEKEVFRCFIEMDYQGEGKGEAELYEVWKGGDNVLLDIKPVDHHPYFAITPNIVPFRHQGQGFPDILEHVTFMKSSMFRGIANAIYHTSNPRPVVNVNMTTDTTEDDISTNLPGYAIRVDGVPDQAVSYQKHDALPNDVFPSIEYLDGTREDMVGSGDETSLDPNQIAQANTGVVWAAVEAKKGKIELMARIMAQVGLRAVFLRIHHLLRNSRRGFMARIAGNMRRVDPSTWIYRDDMEVLVGLGTTNRDKQAMGAGQVLELQQTIVQSGGLGTLVDYVGIYNALSKLVESYELGAADNYFVDPLQAANNEMPEHRAQLLEQVRQSQNQPSEAQVLAEATKEIELLKAQARLQEAQTKGQIEMMKAQLQDQQAAFDKMLDLRKQQHTERMDVEDQQQDWTELDIKRAGSTG